MKKHPEYHSKLEFKVASRSEAIRELYQSDHGFLTEGFVKVVCELFDVPVLIQSEVVDSKKFKGLNEAWDDEGNPLPDGTRIFGADAASLACYICRKKGIPYPEKFGRGSQLRAALGALEQWLHESLEAVK